MTWTAEDPLVGGLSALHVTDGGTRALMLTDKGHLLEVAVLREGDAISGIEVEGLHDLVADRRAPGALFDSEGLAMAGPGTIFVSFEQDQAILRYDLENGDARMIPPPDAFAAFKENRGLEALARGEDGALYTMAESPRQSGDFEVWRLHGDAWSQPFDLPARNRFLAVSAEIGPDGNLYLLERKLTFLGFQSRVRRWKLTGSGAEGETTVLTTAAGRFGNLEGLSLWTDAAGQTRMTLVSDNNFWSFMRMQLVEFVLRE